MNFVNSGDYVVLLEIVFKEFLGLLVCYGDNNWGDIVCWILNVLIIVEELGVIFDNIVILGVFVNLFILEINCLLGIEGILGEMLGLDVEWVKCVIMVGGNYGEVFVNNIGEDINIGLVCGVNVKWIDGGLIYFLLFW